MIRLNNTKVLKSGTSRNNMGFVSLWKFHGDSKWNKSKISLLQTKIISSTKVDPVGLPINISKFLNLISKDVYKRQGQESASCSEDISVWDFYCSVPTLHLLWSIIFINHYICLLYTSRCV